MDKKFTTDNCSLVPDYDQSECCVEHDWAYWKGGSFKDRWEADTRFLQCIKETRSRALAPFRWVGVRIGGIGLFPSTFRWGYGWTWPRTGAPRDDRSPISEESQRGVLAEKLAIARERDRRRRQAGRKR